MLTFTLPCVLFVITFCLVWSPVLFIPSPSSFNIVFPPNLALILLLLLLPQPYHSLHFYLPLYPLNPISKPKATLKRKYIFCYQMGGVSTGRFCYQCGSHVQCIWLINCLILDVCTRHGLADLCCCRQSSSTRRWGMETSCLMMMMLIMIMMIVVNNGLMNWHHAQISTTVW